MVDVFRMCYHEYYDWGYCVILEAFLRLPFAVILYQESGGSTKSQRRRVNCSKLADCFASRQGSTCHVAPLPAGNICPLLSGFIAYFQLIRNETKEENSGLFARKQHTQEEI